MTFKKVSVNALYQQGSLALDAVGSGLVHGLTAPDIGPQLRLGRRTEIYVRGLGPGQGPLPLPHGNAGTNRVPPPGKLRQHPQGVCLVPGLA